MIIKMLITFDYDPETNEYKALKQEIVKDKAPKAVSKAVDAKESSEPQITLESNKYILNKVAIDLMGVKWEDRLDIKYQKIDNLMFPVIGTDITWKTKSGNKITKNLTVSCRGSANELLSKYGDTFTITPWKGYEGLFVLIGNKDREPEIEDDNIKIREDNNPVEDLPMDIEIDNKEAYKINDLSFEL